LTDPTMQDVARVAGVGVATVDRVINRRAPVRSETAQRVLDAAEKLGFRRAGLIKRRIGEQQRPIRLGYLLQDEHDLFYKELGQALRHATQDLHHPAGISELVFMADFTPRKVVESLHKLAKSVDAIGLVAADHPAIHQAIEELHAMGVPVFALISDLTTPNIAGYVGVDNRKMGRTAAWAMSKLCPRPGKLGLILGSHRYLCQEQCEISFRSFLRENTANYQVLETMVSLEDRSLAQAATLELIHCHPDLVGVYVAGGGIEGVLEAIKEANMPDLITVCHDLTELTRQALLDGLVTVVLSHPFEWIAQSLCNSMIRAMQGTEQLGKQNDSLPFTTYTIANV